MNYTIYIHPRPSDPSIYRMDGERKALEALQPIRENDDRINGTYTPVHTERIECNCTFDGPAVGLSTIHCFNCDGKGYYDDFSGFSIKVKHFEKYYEANMAEAGITIEWAPYEDSKIRWEP